MNKSIFSIEKKVIKFIINDYSCFNFYPCFYKQNLYNFVN